MFSSLLRPVAPVVPRREAGALAWAVVGSDLIEQKPIRSQRYRTDSRLDGTEAHRVTYGPRFCRLLLQLAAMQEQIQNPRGCSRACGLRLGGIFSADPINRDEEFAEFSIYFNLD
jgi:hypothetical protein